MPLTDALEPLAGRHALVVPRGTDLLPLARAWFPAAAWSREPVGAGRAPAPAPMTGARFRGIVVAAAPESGTLTVPGGEVEGPFALDAHDARALGLPPRDGDVYGLSADADRLVVSWAHAVARRTAGCLVPAERDHVVVPDAAALVDLTLWSAVPLPVQDAAGIARRALPGSRLTVGTATEGAGFVLTASYPYDGDVTVRCARAREVPAVLTTLHWREHGPWGYHVAWVPPDPVQLELDDPSPLHVVARQRVAPGVAGLVEALRQAAGGAVVDTGGFLVSSRELEGRARGR